MTRRGFEDHSEIERTDEDCTGHRGRSLLRLWCRSALVTFWAHIWMIRGAPWLIWSSNEIHALALFPRGVTTTSCAHMRSHATLVITPVVLKSETHFLTFALEDKFVLVVSEEVCEKGLLAFPFSFPLGWTSFPFVCFLWFRSA